MSIRIRCVLRTEVRAPLRLRLCRAVESALQKIKCREPFLRTVSKPQPNGVRPSSGAETSDGYTCGNNPERQTSLQLLRPGTAALREFRCSSRTISTIGLRCLLPLPAALGEGIRAA